METWLQVVGWEGTYEVSSLGNVRGIKRRGSKGGLLAPGTHEFGYRMVTLRGGGRVETRTVHSLVAEAFIGPRPEGQEVRHRRGVDEGDGVDNLEYGTRTENNNDKRKHRVDAEGYEVCGQGHRFYEWNTMWENGGKHRRCRTCRNQQAVQRYRA